MERLAKLSGFFSLLLFSVEENGLRNFSIKKRVMMSMMQQETSSSNEIHSRDIRLSQDGSGLGTDCQLVSPELKNSAVFKRTVKEFGDIRAAEIFVYLNNVFHEYGYREGGSRTGHDFEEAVKSLLGTLGIRFVSSVKAGKSEVDFLIHGPKETVLLEVKLAKRDNHEWQVSQGEKMSVESGHRYIVAVGVPAVAKAIASVI
jgi:hypothetical protein